MPTDETHELLTVSEVCDLLRIRASTCYAAAEDGRLPCVRLWRGRRKSLLRFRRTDIESMIAGTARHPQASGVS
jgi:excisionase family DNA binding protein